MQYVELHARSAFSFLEGGSLPESLMITAAGLGLRPWRYWTATVFTVRRAFHMAGEEDGSFVLTLS